MKLKTNNIIQVHGEVFLAKIEGGQSYRIRTEKVNGLDVYRFYRPRGSKCLWRHYADAVDPWVRDPGCPDLNHIEIVGEPVALSLRLLLHRGRVKCPACGRRGMGYANHPHAFGHKDLDKAQCRYCRKTFRIRERKDGKT